MAKKKRGKAKASHKKATAKKRVSKRKVTAKKKVAAKKRKSAIKRKAAKVKRKTAVKKTKKTTAVVTSTQKFNMLVTYDPNHRGLAETELREILKQAGELPKFMATEVEGLFKVAVKDARTAAKKITSLVRANPTIFMTTHHYTPIDSWTKSTIEDMQQAVKKAAERIADTEKWKMSLNKRHWDKMESTPLIIKLTEVVNKPKVDLSNPQKIIQIEIIGEEAGIALLSPEELVDIPKLKAAL